MNSLNPQAPTPNRTDASSRDLDAGEPILGDLDITYQTHQRDMFTSGLAARIGTNAFGVWCAIKSHSDFQTGECWPGVRRLMQMTGLASATTQKAIRTLLENHLLRVTRSRGQARVYIARERLDVRVGSRIVCTIVMDYVPSGMRERLKMLKDATAGELAKADVWAQVEILPGPGMEHNPASQTFQGQLLASDVALQFTVGQREQRASDARAQVRSLADKMRADLPQQRRRRHV